MSFILLKLYPALAFKAGFFISCYSIIYFKKKVNYSATVWLFICIFATVFHRILDFTTRLGFYPAFINECRDKACLVSTKIRL